MVSQEKIKDWVGMYLTHVKEIGLEKHINPDPRIGEEGYKFVSVDHFLRNFNLEASNLAEMLDEAIMDSNLVAGVQYLPKRMLLLFAKEHEKETRDALRLLFDEESLVYERLNSVQGKFDFLVADRNKRLGTDYKTFIGLRFLSLLLSFRYPDKYNAIKPSNWKIFCKYIDNDFNIPNKSSIGDQYRTYEQYIDALRTYIMTLPEIDEIRKQITNGLIFNDSEFRWMAQNVIYVGSDQLEPTVADIIEKTEKIAADEGDEFETNDDFKSETALEVHIAKHWKSIPYFNDFELVRGSAPHGGQYPANGKAIDLLAYSTKRKLWLVIELKKRGNPDSYRSVGQVQTYMGFVVNKLAKEGDYVRGLIITGEYDEDIANATAKSVTPNVGWLVYSVRTQYTDFNLRDPQGDPRGFDDLFSK